MRYWKSLGDEAVYSCLLEAINFYLFIYLFIYFSRFMYLFHVGKYTVTVFRHTRRGHRMDPHYRWLGATMWLLGIELRASGRVVRALNR